MKFSVKKVKAEAEPVAPVRPKPPTNWSESLLQAPFITDEERIAIQEAGITTVIELAGADAARDLPATIDLCRADEIVCAAHSYVLQALKLDSADKRYQAAEQYFVRRTMLELLSDLGSKIMGLGVTKEDIQRRLRASDTIMEEFWEGKFSTSNILNIIRVCVAAGMVPVITIEPIPEP